MGSRLERERSIFRSRLAQISKIGFFGTFFIAKHNVFGESKAAHLVHSLL